MASAGDIFTFLGVAFKTVQYFQGIRRAPKERDTVLEQINSLVSVFSDLKGLNPLMTIGLSKQDQDRLRSLIDQIDPKLEQLRQDLLQKPKRFDEFYTRFRWPSTKAEVQAELADLESAVRNIKRCQEMATAKRSAWNEIRRLLRPNIAEKVRDTPYIDKVTQGTGEGLLRSKEFEDWKTAKNGVLWCNGPREYSCSLVKRCAILTCQQRALVRLDKCE